MGSLERRLQRILENAGMPSLAEDEAKRLREEQRRAEIIAELEAIEARRRSMSEAEWEAEWEAWRSSPEGQAAARARGGD